MVSVAPGSLALGSQVWKLQVYITVFLQPPTKTWRINHVSDPKHICILGAFVGGVKRFRRQHHQFRFGTSGVELRL